MSEWYCLRTASGKERAVAASLAEREHPFFLPMETDWRGQPRVKHMEPLLPGYVFILGELEDIADLIGIEHVISFVRYIRNDGVAWPAAFPATAILGLQMDERAGAFDKTRHVKAPKYRPRKGEVVKIMAGPYFSFLAKVLAAPRSGRCKLLIEGPFAPRKKTLDVAHLAAA